MGVCWETTGLQPFDERMMTALHKPCGNTSEGRHAAGTLARPRGGHYPRWARFGETDESPRGPSPAVAKFSGPTAAEAILTALDRDRQVRDARPDRFPFRWEYIEEDYLAQLVDLGD